MNWSHVSPTFAAAFLASLVECVEALTVVLAVGSTRGWRSALTGSVAAIGALALIVIAFGPALARIPLESLQLAVGTLLLLFGMRWLRKAILRGAGVLPLHDEEEAFHRQRDAMRGLGPAIGSLDPIAFMAAFKITLLEGIEVVFIVIALGAGDADLLLPASIGAVAALITVIALGAIVHRPLSRVPENALKFLVGALLCAFGTFWVGEGLRVSWPGADGSLLGLIAGFLVAGIATVPLCRRAWRGSEVRS